MTLQEFFKLHPKAALGFSGGTDSAYLLHAAKEAGADVKPYFVKTVFQPAFELADAIQLAPEVTIIDVDILSAPYVEENPANRCYHCKKALFSALKAAAEADGYPILLDGTNASDQWDDRPGMRALEELGVLSPLRMCGLTKDEIRRRSQEAGLFTWAKPAYACLATRMPANTKITVENLKKVEISEQILRDLGYSDLRIRLFYGAARVQLPENQLKQADIFAIREALKPYFDQILLDLEGR